MDKTKITKGITALLCVSTLLTSCVSKRKYNDMVKADKNHQSELASVRKQLNESSQSASAALEQKQLELNKEDALLKEREKKLEELRAAMQNQKDAVLNLKQQVCSALKCFSPDELTVTVRDGKLYVSMSDKLLFPSGSEAVNKRGMEAIEMLSAVLKSSDLEVMVEGHTDPLPIHNERSKDNWDLSVHRATGVARLMIHQGIKPERIIPCGRAEFFPLASNDSETGRQQNRRTEIILAPKLDKLWKLTEEPNTENPTSQR